VKLQGLGTDGLCISKLVSRLIYFINVIYHRPVGSIAVRCSSGLWCLYWLFCSVQRNSDS